VGAINIDATRIPVEGSDTRSGGSDGWDRVEFGEAEPNKYNGDGYVPNEQGRFPSNVIGEIAEPYQKYFYCPKVSRRERHIGHTLPDAEPLNSPDQVRNHPLWDPSVGTNAHRLKEKIRKSLAPTGHIKGPYDENGNRLAVTLDNANLPGNNHPTVKPIELMKYLIRLITPPGGTVLDPFNGSGSTGCAAVELGMEYIGVELDAAYVAIARTRIEAWYAHTHPLQATGLFE
jgi:site-specific DNA-methyltransferase (adenine-specific)